MSEVMAMLYSASAMASPFSQYYLPFRLKISIFVAFN